MPEYLHSQLPLDINERELRFVRLIRGEPAGFEEKAIEHGWRTKIKEELDNNRCKVNYRMSRLAPEYLDDGDLDDIRKDIGIMDEDGNRKTDYCLWEESVKPLSDRAWQAGEPIGPEKRILYFEFEGFPTDETLDIMQSLMTYFYDGEDFDWTEPPQEPSAAKRNIDKFFEVIEPEESYSRMNRIRGWLGKIATKVSRPKPPKQYPQRWA